MGVCDGVFWGASSVWCLLSSMDWQCQALFLGHLPPSAGRVPVGVDLTVSVVVHLVGSTTPSVVAVSFGAQVVHLVAHVFIIFNGLALSSINPS